WTNTGVGIYLAVIPMFAGYVLFGVGLARVQASTAIVITLVEPIIAALLAVVIVGEHLPLLGWVGAALIVSSLVALTVRLPRRRTDMDSQKRTSTMAGAPVSRPTSSESP
ncbi:MAG: hypothetical protein JWP75_2646, partial [Frondihabitans sp.]|nr:hypothetical protein [Frondihabitans sp.]